MGTLASHIYELAHIVGAVNQEGVFSAVSNTSGTDAVGLAGFSDDDLNGQFAYVWSGTGVGQERRITDFTGATGVITVPTWGTNPTDASYFTLNPHWRIANLRTAIKLAIREQRKFYMLPKVDTSLTLDFDATPVYEYTVPTGFACIDDIWVERTAGGSDYLDPVPPDAWYINRGSTKQIVFEKAANDRLGFMKNGHKIKVVGQEYETEPTADSSTLTIPMGALIFLAAAFAHGIARSNDVNNARGHGQLMSVHQQTWLNMRGDDRSLPNPGTRWVAEF